LIGDSIWDGNPKLLEVNPNPGWCWDGHLAKMAKFAGINYQGMLEAIIKAAEVRLGILPTDEKREKESSVRAETLANVNN